MNFLKYVRHVIVLIMITIVISFASGCLCLAADYFWLHPDRYAINSAPWYTPMLIWAIVDICLIFVLGILWRLARRPRKGKKHRNQK